MDNSYYVYQLRLDNFDMPFYVGKGKGNRAYQHVLPSSRNIPSHKNNVINKHLNNGGAVIVEILDSGLTNIEALSYERFYISAYGRYNKGGILTNNTDGGEGCEGYRHTIESKKILSEMALNRTDEHKIALSKSLCGKRRSVSGDIKVSDKNKRFSEEEYVHICLLLMEGVAHRTIAKIFNCGKTVIGSIKQRTKYKRWEHYLNNDSTKGDLQWQA